MAAPGPRGQHDRGATADAGGDMRDLHAARARPAGGRRPAGRRRRGRLQESGRRTGSRRPTGHAPEGPRPGPPAHPSAVPARCARPTPTRGAPGRTPPARRDCRPSAGPGPTSRRPRPVRCWPPGTADYQNWQLGPRTVYYLAPGVHYGSFSANTGDVFVGGWANGTGASLDGQYSPVARRSTATSAPASSGTSPSPTSPSSGSPRIVDQTAVNQTGQAGGSC